MTAPLRHPLVTVTILIPVELSISLNATEADVRNAVQSLQENLGASQDAFVDACVRGSWKTRQDRLSVPAVVRHWMEAAKAEAKKLRMTDVIKQRNW